MKGFRKYLMEMLGDFYDMSVEVLIDKIEENPELEKYVVDGSTYDDVRVENLPIKELQRVFGIGQKELEQINNNTEDYEGSIGFNEDGTIYITGAA
jgi:hypothetical protein